MKQDKAAAYKFHLQMWAVTDPYTTDVEDASRKAAPQVPPFEFRALDALANFFRHAPQPRVAPAKPS